MKIYTLGLYEKAMPSELSWKEKLVAVGEAGFDFVEISIDETDEKLQRLDMSRVERMELVRLMEETGTPIRSMCLSGHRKYPFGSENPLIRRKSIEIMEKAIQLAEDLGIRIIQLAGYDVYYEKSTAETRRQFEKNLKYATEMAACKGILMGFETMETEFMDTVEKAMNYVNKIKYPWLQVYPDCGNLTNAAILYGTDILQDMETGRGHLVAMHLKETVPGKYREIPFGEGHVNFETAIAKAWELGARRFVTESWYKGNSDWRKELEDVGRRMRKILDTMKTPE